MTRIFIDRLMSFPPIHSGLGAILINPVFCRQNGLRAGQMIHFFSESNLSFPGAILKVIPWESETIWNANPGCDGLIEGFSETPEGKNPIGDVQKGDYEFKIIPVSEVSMATATVVKLTADNDYLTIDDVECNNLRNWIRHRKIPVNNGYRFSHNQTSYMFCEHRAPFVSGTGGVGCYLHAMVAINQALQREYDRLCNDETLRDDITSISSDEQKFAALIENLQIKFDEVYLLLATIEADVKSWPPEQTNGIGVVLNIFSCHIDKMIRNWGADDGTAWPDHLKSLTVVLSEFTKELLTAWQDKPFVKEPDVSEETTQKEASVGPDSRSSAQKEKDKYDDLRGAGSTLEDDEDEDDS